MRPATQPCRPVRTSEPVSRNVVLRAFRTTYADALRGCQTEAQWTQAARIRRLVWRSRQRLSLADAVACYGQLGSYNAFRPKFIAELHGAFATDGIQVTPAREYSVAIYLHIAPTAGLRGRVEQFVRARFDADEVQWRSQDTLRVWWD